MKKALCFDDVLLVPKFFEGNSRSEIDISTTISGLKLSIPLIAANMPAVCEEKMAIAIGKMGGLGILHRLCSIERQVEMVSNVKKENVLVGASIGIQDDALSNAKKLIDAGVDLICLDVAFFAQKRAHEVARRFMSLAPNFPFIVGNIATPAHKSHFDPLDKMTLSYKLGIGSGAACLTRINAGSGLPTLSSIMNFRERYEWTPIVADGGHKNAGDCVKSLAAGADAVMIGSLLAGTDDAPGEIIEVEGAKFKNYFGNASAAGKKTAGIKIDHIEGDSFLVPYKGSAQDIISRLLDGIRSGMSYSGAMNLHQLRRNAEFVEISNAGYIEGTAHGKNKS